MPLSRQQTRILSRMEDWDDWNANLNFITKTFDAKDLIEEKHDFRIREEPMIPDDDETDPSAWVIYGHKIAKWERETESGQEQGDTSKN